MADQHQPADPNRRTFLRQAGAAGAGVALASGLAPADTPGTEALPLSNTGADRVPRKPLGRTGQHVSVLGIGGAHLGRAASLPEATRIVHEAIDAGVTFMDNAWEYNNGRSEEWMGQALRSRR